MITVYIDADACPVTRIAEDIARNHGIPVTLLCDTNHQLTSDYSTVRVIGAGVDAVDIADQRLHHEIYLSDVRKAAPEKLKTVIRHPIRP